MDTIPEHAAGTTLASNLNPTSDSYPARAQSPHTGLGTGGHDLRQLLVYKAFIKSGLMEPFRILLRPLRKWVLRRHVAIHPAEGDPALLELPLRQPSTTTLVLSILLGPVVFVMLLPLLLILVPVALGIGLAALLVSASKATDENMGLPLAETGAGPGSH